MPRARRAAFTLVEVLVATAVTALIAGLMITVIVNVMNAWRRSADSLLTNSQAKVALEYLAQDLNVAVFRRDARVWLIATVQPDQSAAGDVGGTLPTWVATGGGTLKPGWASPGTPNSSLSLAPASGRFDDHRFGMAGVWLRLITGVTDSNASAIQQTSAPRAVGYQVVRHSLSSAAGSAIRYALFRTEVRPFHDTAGSQAASTFVSGYDLSVAAYTTVVGTNNTADAGNIRRPLRGEHLLANNVVDFGVRFYTRDPAGNLVLSFPVSNSNLGFLATTDTSKVPVGSSFGYPASSLTYGFPDVAEVFVRVLTEEGARQVEALESGRLPGLNWWTIVTANSRVYTRRVALTGRPL